MKGDILKTWDKVIIKTKKKNVIMCKMEGMLSFLDAAAAIFLLKTCSPSLGCETLVDGRKLPS